MSQKQRVTSVGDSYTDVEWTSGTFISGVVLGDWLLGAIEYFDTADKNDKRIKHDLTDLQKALNKVLHGPRKQVRENDQESEIEKMVGQHHEIIYRVISLNNQTRINQVLDFIAKMDLQTIDKINIDQNCYLNRRKVTVLKHNKRTVTVLYECNGKKSNVPFGTLIEPALI
jgi:hypothetical protein